MLRILTAGCMIVERTGMVDIDAAADFQRKRVERILAARRERWAIAAADAERIVAMIVRKYQPDAVYQWGSVLRPEKFTEVSDIDIAVEGVDDPAQFSELLGEAEDMTRLPLDIVQLEHIEPEFRELIVRYGRCVHERTN
ncbi:MAG: nucleotidyltransferase domain-containing protein [Spirochaetaceae bacterium]|nr:MAG: nucleotidyltransferase domain-containing protein [Spirochaetaceae bacterium]